MNNFQITPQMLENFARLTGDYNSLHLDPEYARRSSHRQNIVHGLLPLSFLFTAEEFKNLPSHFFIKEISVNFLRAIYAGQQLQITTSSIERDIDKDLEISYDILSHANQLSMTQGSIVLSKNLAQQNYAPVQSHKTDSLLVQPIVENILRFNDVLVGQEESIPFCVHSRAILSWQTLISQGLQKRWELPINLSINNFMASLMCSPFVGMRLPGQLATFVNLALHFHTDCAVDQNHLLQGKVAFKSASTQILIENFYFKTHNDSPSWSEGKVTVKMEEPALGPISITDIKASHEPALNGKVVLITGASRGIGATTAKMFSLLGAKVIVNYHRGQKDALAVVEDIEKNQGAALAIQADVTDRRQVSAMINAVQEKFGTIHVLVNNAADFSAVPFLNLTWDQVQNDLDIILKGAFNCCQEVLPLMLKNKGGKIINVGTIATEYPLVLQSKYVIAKSALVGLTRSLAVEFAAYNIQINMVMPSMVETDLSKAMPAITKEQLRRKNPMTRFATTIDVARAITMLASQSTSFTTGQRFFVTGGEAPLL